VEKLVGRYCSSWDDLVVITDDLIKASPRRSRKENYKTFACNLKTRLEEGLRSLSDACFEHAVVDISDADSVTTMDTAEILRRLTLLIEKVASPPRNRRHHGDGIPA
jgi:hypothetical protein